jgi:hypothetical protein
MEEKKTTVEEPAEKARAAKGAEKCAEKEDAEGRS